MSCMKRGDGHLDRQGEEATARKTMRELERVVPAAQRRLQVDGAHRRHGSAASKGMGLRGYGQRDPVVEYRIEGFATCSTRWSPPSARTPCACC